MKKKIHSENSLFILWLTHHLSLLFCLSAPFPNIDLVPGHWLGRECVWHFVSSIRRQAEIYIYICTYFFMFYCYANLNGQCDSENAQYKVK